MLKRDDTKINGSNIEERGEIMLEGMVVTVLTVFILIWLLGLGFLYYQRYLTTIVTNDAAAKIASTYNNPTSDIIMGYITTEELKDRDLYRNFASASSSSDLLATNEDRAASYIKYMLDRTNFTGVVKEVDVNLRLVKDSLVRKHVEITVTCEYKTPFGDVFHLFGMNRTNTYQVTSRADCTDVIDYFSTVNFVNSLTDNTYTSNMGFVSSVVKMINSFVKRYNHLHS